MDKPGRLWVWDEGKRQEMKGHTKQNSHNDIKVWMWGDYINFKNWIFINLVLYGAQNNFFFKIISSLFLEPDSRISSSFTSFGLFWNKYWVSSLSSSKIYLYQGMPQRIQYSSHTKEISASQGMAFWVYCMSTWLGCVLAENLLQGIKKEDEESS